MGVQLYKLLPSIIRLQDSLASAGDEGNLEKITYALEQETDVTTAEIAGLSTLLDSDTCPEDYLLYQSLAFGSRLNSSWDERTKRWFVKNLVWHYKTKGTHPSWHREWNWSLGVDYGITELEKDEVYAVGGYTRDDQGYYTGLRAARFDVDNAGGGRIPVAGATDLAEYIDGVRPIHVLLRKEYTLWDDLDTFSDASDEWGCVSYCETGVQWSGGTVLGYFNDDFPMPDGGEMGTGDELLVTVTCYATCELSCQGCCELDACELAGCQTTCENACQHACEGVCEDPCEAVCQAGIQPCFGQCEAACQVFMCQAGDCQGDCEGQWEPGPPDCTDFCEFGGGCQAGPCEQACQQWVCQSSSCQDGCTCDGCTACNCELKSCEGSCETACQAFTCQLNGGCQAGACEVGCVYGCTACEADCEPSCTQSCQTTSCEGAVQT